jgi:hypothetical protein
MLEFDFAFPRSYEVQEVREWPGTGSFDIPVIYFPRPKNRAEHNGLWLRVRAKSGKAWIGVFASDHNSPPAFSRVLSSPDSESVCVVSDGSAYIVKAEQPDEWEQVPITPVLDVRPLLEQKLLLFADFIRLAAYGSNKLAWRSPRVCWDGLKITNVTSDIIEGTGYGPTNAVTRNAHCRGPENWSLLATLACINARLKAVIGN